MVPDWHKQCEPFIQGFPCSLTSSFSKLFTSDELMTLVDLESITISVDCADEVLLRSVRRKVSLQTILQNIQNLRETAKAHHISPPRLVFSAGVYDRNVFVLEDLAELAIRLKISKVIFWNYVEQPGQPPCPVRPIDSFDKDTFAAALDCLQRAVQKLRASRIAVELAGNFAASTRAELLPPVPELNADRAVAK